MNEWVDAWIDKWVQSSVASTSVNAGAAKRYSAAARLSLGVESTAADADAFAGGAGGAPAVSVGGAEAISIGVTVSAGPVGTLSFGLDTAIVVGTDDDGNARLSVGFESVSPKSRTWNSLVFAWTAII